MTPPGPERSTPSANAQTRGKDLAVTATIPVLVWLLYGRISDLWWMFDDFYHLRYIATHSLFKILFDPRTCRALSARMFTPGLFFSLAVDRRIWGVRPEPFYWHQLIAMALAGVALFLAMRFWLSRSLSVLATLLFLVGLPVSGTVPLLMERHYVEGLGAAIVASLFFLEERRTGRRTWGILSGITYFTAMAAKEVYVPAIAVLVLLTPGDLRQRARRLLPQGIALALYLCCRFVMIGTLWGGYGWAVAPGQWPLLLAKLPLKIVETFVSDRPEAAIAVALMLMVAAVWTWRSGRVWSVSGLALLTLAPIVPVATLVEPRYGLLAWLLLIVIFAAACEALEAHLRHTGRAISFVVLAMTLVANRRVWERDMATWNRMSTEAFAYGGLTSTDALAHPAVPPASMDELGWVNEHLLGRSGTADRYYDDIWLCQRRHAQRLWAYDSGSKTMHPIQSRCPSWNVTAPFSVVFRSKSGDLFWSFGPYEKGSYRVINDEGRRAYDVPRVGGYQFGSLKGIGLRVKYTAPAGWATYSPVLTISLDRDSGLKWSRPGGAP